MNIKEVEIKTGLKKANIRFYEQQGLLVPERNEKNNYREYGMEDVETLEKIKILRTLEISIQDIRKLQEGKVSLPELMTCRLGEIESAKNRLEELSELCRRMKTCGMTFDSVDTSFANWNNSFFKMKEENIMKLDRIRKTERRMANVRKLMCGCVHSP